jgi:diguanylate cyclase (GGDEF)-like protein/PAS domain S-box-containing protein
VSTDDPHLDRARPGIPTAAWIALIGVVACGLLVTSILLRMLGDAERRRQVSALAEEAEQVIGGLQARFKRHEVQLVAAKALFESSDGVTRDEWRRFARTFAPLENGAGFSELAWVPRVTAAALASLHAQAHADGLSGFAVRSSHEREFQCPIFYNEPQERYLTSLGRDVCDSPTAYPAMQRARSVDRVAMSHPLQLETADGSLQPGYALFVWVDAGPGRHEGWAAGTLTMSQLFAFTRPGQASIGVRVVDVSTPGGARSVFDGKPAQPAPAERLEIDRELALAGRDLRLQFTRALQPSLSQALVLGTGSLISLLLGGFMFTLLCTRARALRVADQMTRAWRRSEDMLSSIAGNVHEGIYRLTPDDGLVYVNRALAEIFGFDTPREMIAHPDPMRLEPPDQRDRLIERLDKEGQYRGQEVTFVRRDGTQFVAVDSAVATRDDHGRIQFVDGVIMDITERKRAADKVYRLAHYDTLTDLPNRTLFDARIREVLSQAQRGHRSVAVMFIDLDRFKIVNDSLGHRIGDRLLVAVAQRLRKRTRDYDIVSRQGGDEFIIVLPDTDAHGAARKAEELLADLAGLPFQIDGHELTITPSIGVAMYPDDARDAESLLSHADAAMYHAKERGRSTYQFFTEALNERVTQRLTMENHLRGALARGELSLVYQPLVDLTASRITGTEALLRWRSPALGSVPPGDFIPVAEQCGLIGEIGDWVIDAACRQIACWRDQGIEGLSVAVNVSAVQFWRSRLDQTIRQALTRWRIDPANLVVELTESTVMDNAEVARRTLDELKKLGIRLAIDDFGTGYSSLGYLKTFPIDLLKIDRSFVQGVVTDASDAAIVAAVLSMAHDLRMQVVAEGIEDHAQLEYIRSRKGRYAQGYLFSPPVPPEAIPPLLARPLSLTPDACETAAPP